MSKVLIKGTRQILMLTLSQTVNGGRIRLEKKIVFDLKRCVEMNVWKLNVNLCKLLHLVIAQLLTLSKIALSLKQKESNWGKFSYSLHSKTASLIYWLLLWNHLESMVLVCE